MSAKIILLHIAMLAGVAVFAVSAWLHPAPVTGVLGLTLGLTVARQVGDLLDAAFGFKARASRRGGGR